MDDSQDIRMPLASLDVTAERIEALRELFPEAFTEGKVDFEQLKQALGEFADDSPERYGLSWAGKAEAKHAFQSLSSGTLVPLRDESVNFDTTENLIIEGDNLEVLKLLQKSYFGRVKMIYIDPPYNTGNEFIYPDDYREGLDGYLRYSGQVTDEGIRIETNTETSGRFHSKWLSMMYPRLFLARNLLTDDGVVFISIDDNEVGNLRSLCDEVFGEENRLSDIVWKKKYIGGKHAKHFVDLHEYILVYAKDGTQVLDIMITRPSDEQEKFDQEDEYLAARGKHYTRPLKSNLAERKTLIYPIELPDGGLIETQWMVSRDTFDKLVSDGRIVFKQKSDGSYNVYRKFYEKDNEGLIKFPSIIDDVSNSDGKLEFKALFAVNEGREIPFPNPKPSELIRFLATPMTSQEDAIVLDFFAGSGTTAHAVLDLNNRDCGQRKFILVQLPEPTEGESIARNMGYATIADICRERVRRVIKRLNDEDNGKLDVNERTGQDRGFRAFRLTSSNFKLWNPDEAPTDAEGLAEQLRLYADHVLPNRSQEDILYELLLKAGVPLGAKIAKVKVAGRTAFDVSDGLLLICLEDEVTEETLRAMMERKPEQVLCLDNAFKGNDQLKTNTVLDMQSHDIKFHTV